MNTLLMSIARSTLVGVGLVGTSVALAHQPHGYPYRHWQPRPVYVERDYVQDYDYARVIDVDPIIRRVAVNSPQRDCWVEDRQVYGEPRSHTPAVLGAIIGGVVGHQFGSGHSRNAATVAGAVLGASVGHDVSARDAGVETRSVERCEVNSRQDWQERIEGYRVTYLYRGREYRTEMPYDPGNRVQVRVGVDVDVVR